MSQRLFCFLFSFITLFSTVGVDNAEGFFFRRRAHFARPRLFQPFGLFRRKPFFGRRRTHFFRGFSIFRRRFRRIVRRRRHIVHARPHFGPSHHSRPIHSRSIHHDGLQSIPSAKPYPLFPRSLAGAPSTVTGSMGYTSYPSQSEFTAQAQMRIRPPYQEPPPKKMDRRQFKREIVKADCLLNEGYVYGSPPVFDQDLSKAIGGVRDIQRLIQEGSIPDNNNVQIAVGFFSKGADPNAQTDEFAGTHYVLNDNPPHLEKMRAYFESKNIQPATNRDQATVQQYQFADEKQLSCTVRQKMDITGDFAWAGGYSPAFRKERERIIRLLAQLADEGYRPRDMRVQSISIVDSISKPYGNLKYHLGLVQYGNNGQDTLNIPMGTTREDLLPYLTKRYL